MVDVGFGIFGDFGCYVVLFVVVVVGFVGSFIVEIRIVYEIWLFCDGFGEC